jgi:ATP-dependent DNA helicase DinG
MRSLPAMPITQDINQVEDFFAQRQVKTAI